MLSYTATAPRGAQIQRAPSRCLHETAPAYFSHSICPISDKSLSPWIACFHLPTPEQPWQKPTKDRIRLILVCKLLPTVSGGKRDQVGQVRLVHPRLAPAHLVSTDRHLHRRHGNRCKHVVFVLGNQCVCKSQRVEGNARRKILKNLPLILTKEQVVVL